MSRLARFVAASGMTNLADGVAVVAWAWLASLLTRDPVLIAVVPVALRLPWAVFALHAGLVADRMDRRRLILRMDLLRALVFAGVAAALWLALPLAPVPARGVAMPGLFAVICAAALCVGIAEVYRDNAAQTVLPALVPHARLERANGRLWSVEIIGNALLGPALGAALIAVAPPMPFAANAVAFGAAILLVRGIQGQFGMPPATPGPWRAELGAGIAFLRSQPVLRLLALITGIWNLFEQMVLIALVLYTQEVLDAGARSYGLILASGAVGGLLGGLCAERVVQSLGPGRVLRLALTCCALAFAALPLTGTVVGAALAFAAFHFFGLLWNTVSVSYRQRTIPDALRGRVNSLYRLLAWGMMPLGLLASGLSVRLAGLITTREVALGVPFVLAALGAGLLTALSWRALGRGFARPTP